MALRNRIAAWQEEENEEEVDLIQWCGEEKGRRRARRSSWLTVAQPSLCVIGHEKEEPQREGKNEALGSMRNIGDPRLPGRNEVEEHYLKHQPYRNLCQQSTDMDHRNATEEDHRIRQFCIDHCFLGDTRAREDLGA